MNNHRWTKFWWGDWQSDPALRMCGLAAQGLWMRLLCVMHDAEPIGHLLVNGRQPSGKQIAALVAAPEKEILALMNELEEAGVYSRTDEGVIYSRRMVRDAAATEAGRQWGKTGGNPTLKAKPNGSPNGGGLTPPDIHPPKPKHQPHPLTEGVGQGVNPEAKKQKKEAEAERRGGSLSLTPSARATPPEIGENFPVLRKNKALRALLPAEWQPSAASLDHAIRLGFDAGWAENQANRMRNWAEMSNAVVDDWDRRFDRWMEVESYTIRQAKAAAEPKSVHQQISEAIGGGKSFLTMQFDDDQPPLRIVEGGRQ